MNKFVKAARHVLRVRMVKKAAWTVYGPHVNLKSKGWQDNKSEVENFLTEAKNDFRNYMSDKYEWEVAKPRRTAALRLLDSQPELPYELINRHGLTFDEDATDTYDTAYTNKKFINDANTMPLSRRQLAAAMALIGLVKKYDKTTRNDLKPYFIREVLQVNPHIIPACLEQLSEIQNSGPDNKVYSKIKEYPLFNELVQDFDKINSQYQQFDATRNKRKPKLLNPPFTDKEMSLLKEYSNLVNSYLRKYEKPSSQISYLFTTDENAIDKDPKGNLQDFLMRIYNDYEEDLHPHELALRKDPQYKQLAKKLKAMGAKRNIYDV